MKRWRKRLTVFSLLAAGCLIWNLSGVGVKAEEAVPQVELTITDGNDVSLNPINNVSLKADITVENYTLTAADFENADVWNPANKKSDQDYTKKNKKCITSGKIIVTIKEGQKSSLLGLGSSYISSISDKISLTTTDGTLRTAVKTEASTFGSYHTPAKFAVIRGNYMTGIVQLLTYNDKTYVVNFPVEVKCSDYLDPVDDSWKENTFASANRATYVNSFIDSANLSDNIITITTSKYNVGGIATADVFLPHLAYGASMLGEDVANITIAGKDKQVYDVKQFLAKIKGGYSFTIKNAEGSTREYS